jgi:hypothetical protein
MNMMGLITWWDAQTAKSISTIGGPRGARRMSLAPDSTGVVFADDGGQVLLAIPERPGYQTIVPPGRREISCLTYTPDSKTLLIAWGRPIEAPKPGDKRARPSTRPTTAPSTPAPVPGPSVEPPAAEPFAVCRWDVAAGKITGVYAGPKSAVRMLATTPDARLLIGMSDAVAATPPALFAWDPATTAPRWTQPLEGMALEQSTARQFGQNGFHLSDDGSTGVWWWGIVASVFDAHTGRPLHRLDRQKYPITATAFDPDRKRVWTSAAHDAVRAYDLKTGELVKTVSISDVDSYMVRFDLTPQRRVVQLETSLGTPVVRKLDD